MHTEPVTDITQLLSSIGQGNSAATSQLLDVVYPELHRLAARYMRRERLDHSLQTTGLVHEAYLRLFGTNNPPVLNDRAHFFAVAANQVRRVLVDHARQNSAHKRKGIHIPIDEAYHISSGRDEDIIALDDALKELAQLDPESSQVVELRFSAATRIRRLRKSWAKTFPRFAGTGNSRAPGCMRGWTTARSCCRGSKEKPGAPAR